METRLEVVPRNIGDTCHVWDHQDQTVTVGVFVQSDYESYSVGEWSFTKEITNFFHNVEHGYGTYHSEFMIAGDQRLTFEIRGEVDNDDMGFVRVSFYADENWRPGSGPLYYPVPYPPSITQPCDDTWGVVLDIDTHFGD